MVVGTDEREWTAKRHSTKSSADASGGWMSIVNREGLAKVAVVSNKLRGTPTARNPPTYRR